MVTAKHSEGSLGIFMALHNPASCPVLILDFLGPKLCCWDVCH